MQVQAAQLEEVAQLEERYQLATYKKMPIVAERGEGVWIYTSDGEKYLDLYGGHAVAGTGHSHPHVVAAIKAQAEKLLFYSNLVYSGMSGAMNEAFSDMAGEAAEYYLRGSNDFRVAAQLVKGQGAIRYMDQPGIDGQSIDNAGRFSDNLDVHYSSGVYNKAFYLLATGSGWNTKKAFQVFARANQLYWTSSSSFDQGACGVQTAASDLGFLASDVSNAFSAVGVSCATAKDGGGTRLYANDVSAAIPDGKTLTSSLTVAGRVGKAIAASKVALSITHPQRSELAISLIAPDGSSYLLKTAAKNDTRSVASDSYSVDLSGEDLNGTWKLQVTDKFRKNIGTLNSWSIEF